jgi:hypothetical protein
MATAITYLLVSGAQKSQDVEANPKIKESDFELEKSFEEQGEIGSALRFSVRRPLEEKESGTELASMMSEAFPEATVTLCTIEQRFNQIEHLQTIVFQKGRRAGEIEHGYLYTVGEAQGGQS